MSADLRKFALSFGRKEESWPTCRRVDGWGNQFHRGWFRREFSEPGSPASPMLARWGGESWSSTFSGDHCGDILPAEEIFALTEPSRLSRGSLSHPIRIRLPAQVESDAEQKRLCQVRIHSAYIYAWRDLMSAVFPGWFRKNWDFIFSIGLVGENDFCFVGRLRRFAQHPAMDRCSLRRKILRHEHRKNKQQKF